MPAHFSFETLFAQHQQLSEQFRQAKRAQTEVVEMRAWSRDAIVQSRELMARVDTLLSGF